MAKQVLSGRFAPGETIYVNTDAKGFTFSEVQTESNGSPKVAKKTAPKKSKEDQIDELKKATKDSNDAIDDVKEDKPDVDPKDN